MKSIPAGVLFSVGIPIGNPCDISVRAKNILETSDFLACEDKRKTGRLLKMFHIQKHGKLLAYHSHNEKDSAEGLLKLLKKGKKIALITDAGSPRISDPGFHLMKLCWENQIKTVPIPGSSALSCLLSISPFPVEPLLFLGFLSPKSGRRKKKLIEYKDFLGSVFFFESVHRLSSFLEDLLSEWGEQTILIGRELTKKHEEIFLGTLKQAIEWSKGKKGEFALLIHKEASTRKHSPSISGK